MPTGPRNFGEFCWINVLTPAPDDAQKFFASLLDWSFVELPGMGHLIQVGGEDVGGLWDLNGPQTPEGTPPGIGVMIRVESADAISERANSLGGTGKPAFDVGPQGRMAEIVDPTGGQIDVWQGAASPGMTSDPTRHGSPNWIELVTTDTARAAEFYRALFGWTTEVMPIAEMEYSVFSMGGNPVGGLMPMMPEMEGFPPHWAAYMTVADAKLAAVHAVQLGGDVFMPPHTIATVGTIVGITSPQGVMFYVIEHEPR